MTPLSRRLLLAAPALLLVRAAAGASLQPGRVAGLSLLPADPDQPDQVVFGAEGVAGAVTLPMDRARIAFVLPIAGREVVGIAFAADPPGATLDLVALVGWDGACLRILGLEVLSCSGADGASLASRFAGVGDRTRISIARTAGVPRPGLPKRWENWTDLLAWRDGLPLADAPVRVPLVGTRQAEVAVVRVRVVGLLSTPCQGVTPALLAAFAGPLSS